MGIDWENTIGDDSQEAYDSMIASAEKYYGNDIMSDTEEMTEETLIDKEDVFEGKIIAGLRLGKSNRAILNDILTECYDIEINHATAMSYIAGYRKAVSSRLDISNESRIEGFTDALIHIGQSDEQIAELIMKKFKYTSKETVLRYLKIHREHLNIYNNEKIELSTDEIDSMIHDMENLPF